MERIYEFVVGWSTLHRARQLSKTFTFENCVFCFIRIASVLPKSAKKLDFSQALDTFRNQYYNEFLYKVQHRTAECEKFVDKMATDASKFQKKDYIVLFGELSSFFHGSVGGSVKGVPLLTHPETSLIESPDWYLQWNYDQVLEIHRNAGLAPSVCVTCLKKKVPSRFMGSGRHCPASSLPLCLGCKMPPGLTILTDCQHLQLPAPSDLLTQHLQQTFEGCRLIAEDPDSTIKNVQLALSTHGKQIIGENKRLLKQIQGLREQLTHSSTDNDEYSISIQNVNEHRQRLELRLYNGEAQYHDLGRRYQDLQRHFHGLQGQLTASIKSSWDYYNKLKELGHCGQGHQGQVQRDLQ